MNIDPKINVDKNSRAQGTKSSSAAAGQGISSSRGEDTVTLSGVHGTVQALSAKLAEVPEVRTERIHALQHTIQSGHYQVDKGKVADAMVKDHSRRSSKA
jgi:flagellar biosynthesis anti-sigma factor FlgM